MVTSRKADLHSQPLDIISNDTCRPTGAQVIFPWRGGRGADPEAINNLTLKIMLWKSCQNLRADI